MPDEPGALWLPNNNFFAGRQGYKPKYIILHGTAGGTDAKTIASYFQSTQGTDNPVSSHYVIGVDGTIVQCVAESDGAWANGVISGPAGTGGDGIHHDAWWDGSINPNNITISIEHVKSHDDNSDLVTGAQMAASFTLVSHICERHGIPKQPADAQGGITGHFSLDPVNRSRCPGAYPFDALWDALKEGGNTTMAGVPQGWTDDGKTLRGPNGVGVTDGFRTHVLTTTWNPDNWPLLAALGLNPLEQGNIALGGGVVQPFRMTILAWTSQKGVYEMWCGQEYIALHQLLSKAQSDLQAAQAQIATLTGQLSTSGSQAIIDQLHATIADYTDRFSKIAQLVKVPQG